MTCPRGGMSWRAVARLRAFISRPWWRPAVYRDGRAGAVRRLSGFSVPDATNARNMLGFFGAMRPVSHGAGWATLSDGCAAAAAPG